MFGQSVHRCTCARCLIFCWVNQHVAIRVLEICSPNEALKILGARWLHGGVVTLDSALPRPGYAAVLDQATAPGQQRFLFHCSVGCTSGVQIGYGERAETGVGVLPMRISSTPRIQYVRRAEAHHPLFEVEGVWEGYYPLGEINHQKRHGNSGSKCLRPAH